LSKTKYFSANLKIEHKFASIATNNPQTLRTPKKQLFINKIISSYFFKELCKDIPSQILNLFSGIVLDYNIIIANILKV